MGNSISNQHPAVVLRSHFNHLRAMLAVAIVVVIGLTVAVVILAAEDDSGANLGSAAQVSTPDAAGATRSDGGPEESAVAGAVTLPSATAGSEESRIAAAIGSGGAGSTATGGPDENVVARAIAGR
jgi:hypothetical protein